MGACGLPGSELLSGSGRPGAPTRGKSTVHPQLARLLLGYLETHPGLLRGSHPACPSTFSDEVLFSEPQSSSGSNLVAPSNAQPHAWGGRPSHHRLLPACWI